MKRSLRIAAWLVVTVLLFVVARRIDWSRALEVIATARPSWLAAAVLANATILMLWGTYWRALLPRDEPNISYGRMFEIVSTSAALMNTLPFGGGHASAVLLLVKRGGVTKRGALSTLAMDQLGEGVVKVSVFVLVAVFVPLPAWMRAGVLTVSLGVAAWLATLLIGSRWVRELEVLRSWSRSARALARVGGMKAMEALAIVAVQHAFGFDLPLAGTLLVLAALILATMLPVAPGNLGTYEASVFLAYRYLGLQPEQALGLAIVQHVCFLMPSLGVGYAYLSAQMLSRSAIASR